MRPRGPDLPHTRLSAAQVRAIRENRHGWSCRRWARETGVHYSTIARARMRDTWAWVR